MRQTVLWNFLFDYPLAASSVQSFPTLKKAHGRPSQSLTSFELNETLSYYTASLAEKKRLFMKYGKRYSSML